MEKKWTGIVAIEGATSLDGRLILPDALVFPKKDALVPVIDTTDWSLVGNADLFLRSGEIIRASGELRIDTDRYPVVYLSGVESPGHGRKGNVVISKAEVKAVLLVDKPAWPECRFEGA